MAQWFFYDNAVQGFMRGNAGWTNITNTTAGAFNIALVSGATFDQTNVTIADFIASGTETANYTQVALTSVALSVATPENPKWTAANVNIVFTGGGGSANYAAIWDTGTSNLMCAANLGAQTISGGSNLVLDLSAGIGIGQDPNT